MKIKILYIQPYASHVGGVDSVLLQLIDGLNKDVYEPYVVLPNPSPYVEKYEKLGAKVIFETLAVFGKPTSWYYYFENLYKLFVSINKIKQIVKKYNIDLIHSHKMELMGGNIVGKFSGIPTVQTVHELPRKPLIAYKFVGLLNHIFNDKVIVLCERSKAVLEWGKYKSKKVEKIYNGIKLVDGNNKNLDLKKELGLEQDAKLAVTVARLSPMKGIEYLLNAATKIKDIDKSIKFVIVGDVAFEHEKSYKEDLIKLAKAKSLENTVFFLGLRRDVPEILEQADVFVLPSVYDIFPTVLLEAMSKGLPIVASDVGGVPEMVRDNTGLIVSPENSEELANGLLKMFSMDYEKFGLNGKKLLENEFTQEIYVRKTVEVYNTILNVKA
ncbi:glycosyltransferase [Metabacillus rhizolycopersici]|uniref:Glycosyltransferase n=1 Tax=Metabacillus rhizolycopersici TaxID=2875709 RepID=A0ABS7UL60_9BACI|nr:glycosyltransferase [Metabacillus rhizolycopersici]MBZ5749055.1 glycosyltransferase [Metabacillus rhizolycopersici]